MKLVAPDLKTLQALAALEHHPDFIKVLGWLRDNQDSLDAEGRILMDELPLRQGQGANQLIDFVLKHAKEARTALSKF